MKLWQKRAEEYSAQGLSNREIAALIEMEFDLPDMYNKVRSFTYYQRKKNKGKPEEKRIVLQNQEPVHHSINWDGNAILQKENFSEQV